MVRDKWSVWLKWLWISYDDDGGDDNGKGWCGCLLSVSVYVEGRGDEVTWLMKAKDVAEVVVNKMIMIIMMLKGEG